VRLEKPGIPVIQARSFLYGASTPEGGLTGILVDGGLGRPEDLQDRQDVRGSILLIRRGEIWFSEKAVNAARSGAAAAIIYNNQPGTMIGVLMHPPGIPVLAIDDEAGEELAGLIPHDPGLLITVTADTQTVASESMNVIGRIPGAAEDSATIILGAHLDSVDTPGANDNASGLAALLEASRLAAASLLRSRVDAELRFIAFGSEEIGLLGSEAYVASLTLNEQNRIAGAVILDTLGAGNVLLIGTTDSSAASEPLVRRAESLAADAGFTVRRETIVASDHAPFSRAGRPAILLISFPYDGIHSDADVIETVSLERTAAVASLAARLAVDMAMSD
jgi:aminopeptidase YwaD